MSTRVWWHSVRAARYAWLFLLAHSIVVLVIAGWMMLAHDDEARWHRSVWLYLLDLPLIPLYGLLFELSDSTFVVVGLSAIVGGALYATVGWVIGLGIETLRRSRMRRPRMRAPFRLAWRFFLAHSGVALIVGGWAMLAHDHEARWHRSLWLYSLDLPIMWLYLKMMYFITRVPLMVILVPGVLGGALYYAIGWGLGLAIDWFRGQEAK